MSENIIKSLMDLIPVVLVGLGAYLIYWPQKTPRQKIRIKQNELWVKWQRDFGSWICSAGKKLTLPQFLAISAGVGLTVGILLVLFTKLAVLGLLGGLAAACIPYLSLNTKRSRMQASRAKAWPHLVDNLVSGVRAGMNLGETLTKVAGNVPPALQAPFQHFSLDYRAVGNLDSSLALLKRELADPVADRIIEALRLAAQVGGNDLVALLEDLGSMIRAEERTRAEILARQSWTITGARLATAAPWIILAMLMSKGQTLEVYSTPTGGTILIVGASISVLAYLLMIRFGRLNRAPRMMTN